MQSKITSVSPSPFRRHGRDSSELDVFDATRYFSGGTDAGVGFHGTAVSTTPTSHPPFTAKQTFDPPQIPETEVKVEKDKPSKKNFKQPVSPGVMLASFFYSFFPQSSKKKTKDEKSSKDNNNMRRSSSRRSSSALTKFDKALWKQRLNGETTKKMAAEINGNESDSSSDLFELKSFADLGANRSSFELPVFGSTAAAAAGGFRRGRRRSSSSSHSVVF